MPVSSPFSLSSLSSSAVSLSCLQHRPWILTAYGIWACWCVLGAPGTAMIFLHTVISFCVAQFRSLFLSWLCSLLLLSTLRLQDVEEVKVRVSVLPLGPFGSAPFRILLFSGNRQLKNCGRAPPSGYIGLVHVNSGIAFCDHVFCTHVLAL